MRRILIGGAIVLMSAVGVAAPASAHDCFNPTKTTGAGSKTLVTLDSAGNEVSVETTGSGKGGFVTIDATAIVPGVVVDIHTFGNGGPQDGVAGPGAEKAGANGCDGKGIDYVETCFGEE
jgi:hypothetical protein